MQSSMLSTNQFIRRKCSKDHLQHQKNSPLKQSSIYRSDYKKKQKLKINEFDHELGKMRNSPLKSEIKCLQNMSTVYRMSFQNNQVVPPLKFKQKQSFFLKTENYDIMESTYMKNGLNKQNFTQNIQRGKPRMDNLVVAKYSKMNTKSLYTDSFPNFTKFPSVYKQKVPPKKQYFRYSCDQQSMKQKKN